MTVISDNAPAARRRRPGGRRDIILSAALELFARHGYQAVGIDEIGAAAGVSGPAIYRHFGSKQELLAAAFIRSFELRREQVRQVMDSASTPRQRLELLLRDTVRDTLDHRRVLTLYTTELNHLPTDDRRAVRRKEREFTNEWVKTVSHVYPRLSLAEARMAVLCVQNLITTLAYTDGGLERERLESLLVDMSLAALGAARPDG